MSLNEFQLISEYFKSGYTTDDVLLGIGDDAAILQLVDGHRLVVSSDTLVESIHFPVNAPPDLVARRALRVNLSDMAAMAAVPRWFTLALTLPISDAAWLQAFSSGLHKDAAHFGCALVGGDTTKGHLNIGVQIMGTVENESTALKRSGAKPGDLLVVTGTLGDAAGALEYLDQQSPSEEIAYLQNRYWLPEPRVKFAGQASSLINAACDISDGLVGDVGHICAASGLGVDIRVSELPLSNAIKQVCGEAAAQKALAGGDDYELCMAVCPEDLEALTTVSKALNVPVTVVGVFRDGESVSCLDESNQPLAKDPSGYRHF